MEVDPDMVGVTRALEFPPDRSKFYQNFLSVST